MFDKKFRRYSLPERDLNLMQSIHFYEINVDDDNNSEESLIETKQNQGAETNNTSSFLLSEKHSRRYLQRQNGMHDNFSQSNEKENSKKYKPYKGMTLSDYAEQVHHRRHSKKGQSTSDKHFSFEGEGQNSTHHLHEGIYVILNEDSDVTIGGKYSQSIPEKVENNLYDSVTLLCPTTTSTFQAKKKTLKATLSCPIYAFNHVYTPSSSATTSPSSRNLIDENPFNSEFWANQSNNKRTDTIVTREPTQLRVSNRYQSYNLENPPEKQAINRSSSTKKTCVHCLYKSKGVLSCCTCYWCLNAFCYHCVSKDDIGYNDLYLKDFLQCKGNLKTNVKRCGITAFCLPCLPLVACYPVINSAIEKCREFLS